MSAACRLSWCQSQHQDDAPDIARHSANIGDHFGPNVTISINVRWGERADGRSIPPHLYIAFTGDDATGTIDLTAREATAWSYILAGIAPEGFTDPLAEMLAAGAEMLAPHDDQGDDGEPHYVAENPSERTGNDRFQWGLVLEVFDVFERHGYRRGDDAHVGRAVGLLGDLLDVYEGGQR